MPPPRFTKATPTATETTTAAMPTMKTARFGETTTGGCVPVSPPSAVVPGEAEGLVASPAGGMERELAAAPLVCTIPAMRSTDPRARFGANSASATARSATLAGRFRLSFSRHPRTTASRPAGTSGRRPRSGGGACMATFTAISVIPSPSNGTRPESSS